MEVSISPLGWGVVGVVAGLGLAGVFVGVFSGMLGIGGGTVMVPLLRLVFGLTAISATATSLFVIVPTSISGAVAHIRNKTCVLKLGVALGLGGAVTSSLGVFLADRSPSWAIMVVAAVIIAYSAYNMLRKALVAGKPRAEDAPLGDDEATYETKRDLACGAGIGLIAGLASGYVGVGGGFIMVPLMTAWLGVPMRKATGTSLVAIIILAIPGVVEYCLLGHVNYIAAIMLTIGTIPGAVLGTKLSEKVPERELRFIFAGFLFVAALGLVVNELAAV